MHANKKSTKSDLKRVDAIKEAEIDYSDHPPLDDSFFTSPLVELSLPKPKKSITLRLDSEILEWYKKLGKGYQTKINAILKSYYAAHHR
jgi:uncharacterized protein (DUF4415 family)